MRASRLIVRVAASCLIGGAVYLGWAWYRCDLWRIAHDAAWPRGFPYPDKLIVALEQHLNRARTAPPGVIKMHGEFQSVQERVAMVTVVLGAAGTGLMLPSLFKWMLRKRARGFPVATNQGNG